MADGPYGVILDMWGQAKEWGLNLDELNPKLFGQVGEFSLKTRFELMMRRYKITVKDLKQVERGEFAEPQHNCTDIEIIYEKASKRLQEKLNAAAAAAKVVDNKWDDISEEELDDYEDASDLLPFEVRIGLTQMDEEVEVVSRGTNDGEIKKQDGDVPTTTTGAVAAGDYI